jgi:hypothetical protein
MLPVQVDQLAANRGASAMVRSRRVARLLYRDSQGREGTVDLKPSEVVFVGRGLECAIRTDDGMVSRRHSQVRMEDGRFVIEDLGSANGVYLNNVRVQKQALDHADIVQCGSLVIRFVDEPVSSPGLSPPPKVGGTMVLERSSERAPSPPHPASQPLPFGGPPAMPERSGAPALHATPADGAPLPFGGPPAMPAARRRAVAASSPALEPPVPTPDLMTERAVAKVDAAPDPAAGKLVALRDELDAMTTRYEREVAENKRARADAMTLRERIEQLTAEVSDRDDRLRETERITDELRDELDRVNGELDRARTKHDELADSVVARERDAARSDDDTARLRDAVAERDRRLGELQRGNDDAQHQRDELQVELDRLRAVIGEQERMLEDRRVGTLARDEVIAKLRGARADTSVIDAARDIHDTLNDALSELRNHGVVVQHEVPNLTGDAARVDAVRDAATALVDGADAAKRTLRRLRDLADRK